MMKKLLITVFLFVGIYLAYFVFRGARFYNYIAKSGAGNTPALVEKTEYSFLLLGYGGPGHDGPYLTDSMMVAHVDLKKNTVALVSLPRDLWVKLPTKSGADFHSKINSIFQMTPSEYPDVAGINLIKDSKYHIYEVPGGIDLLKKVVGNLTGLTIDNYLSVDFGGFEKGVDALGGIDVNILTTFDDYGYPIDGKEKDSCGHDNELAQIDTYNKLPDDATKVQFFKDHPDIEKFYELMQADPPVEAFPCRYEHLHFDKGIVHMDGKTALKYVRSRHSLQDGSDFGRGLRQQQFVKAIKDKLLNVSIVANIFPLMDQLKEHISLDVSSDELKKFMGEAKDVSLYKITTIHMSDSDYLKHDTSSYGGYILIPRTGQDNWSEIRTVIHNSILGITTPTPTPRPTVSAVPTKATKEQ